MFRTLARACIPFGLLLPVAFAWLGGCGGSDVTIAFAEDSGTPAFQTPDASERDASSTFVEYCASNRCPAGWNTCPNSRFSCDVNLWTDVQNCGECGHACPVGSGRESYVCSEGRCEMRCGPSWLDCDGLSDNGCETPLAHDDHCGACGNRCDDPDKPCMYWSRAQDQAGCGCPGGGVYCNGACVDVQNDDNNCGACNHYCDPAEYGGPSYPNTYYGCVNGQCQPKCTSNNANCDGDIENGCEVATRTNENCSKCGDACTAGQECRIGESRSAECMCGPGLTYCEVDCNPFFGCVNKCVDVLSDPKNCGGCGVECDGSCNYGTCTHVCKAGRADCNDAWEDACETNTDSDPRNCGACSRSCDLTMGQACVAGQCVVEPCTSGGDGGTTR